MMSGPCFCTHFFFPDKIWIDIVTDFLSTIRQPATCGTAIVSDIESYYFITYDGINSGLLQLQIKVHESSIQFITLLFLRTSHTSWALENLLELFS